MYRVYVQIKGHWVLMGESASFSHAWEYGRCLKRQDNSEAVKVIGPEGTNEVPYQGPTVGGMKKKA